MDAYTTVPYRNLDPAVPAGLAYAVMSGAMFGDLGHGVLPLAAALLVRSGRWRRLAVLRPAVRRGRRRGDRRPWHVPATSTPLSKKEACLPG